MKYRPLSSTKREIATVGQGTWQLEQADRVRAVTALRHGLDLGMNHIDTAEMYGSGRVEELVGEAVAGRRDEVFLVSKVLPQNASRSGTIAACEKSLKRLRTDRLDCYLLHWRGGHPLEDTISAFKQLRRDGKILSWGVSNFDVADLEEAWKLAGGDNGPACNQVLYHLNNREIERALIPWCERHGVAIVGYSPFANSDRFPDAGTAAAGVLNEIAKAHNATARQVTLNFLVRRPILFAIPKSSSSSHTAENARAAELRLTKAELARIDEAFPFGSGPGELGAI